MAEDKDDWLDDLDSPEEKSAELDQSDIDALLAGSDDLVAPATNTGQSEPAGMELDQSDIDALLSGSSDSGSGGGDSGELDQSDIDALLAGPKTEASNPFITDPDQDEIDKLFSDIDSGSTADEAPFPADEMDFKDIFDSTDSAHQSGLPNFDADEFKLDADIPDIPEIPETSVFDPDATALFPDSSAPPPRQVKPATRVESVPEQGANDAAVAPPPKPWQLLANRKVLYGAGASLFVLLIGAGLFFFKGSSKPPHEEEGKPAVAEQHTPAKEPQEPATGEQAEQKTNESSPHQPAAHEVANGVPSLANLDLTMPPESNQLVIALAGKDPDNDPLEYEFVSMPEHGQLAGHAPNLVYIPKADYSGSDSFSIRVTDGKNASAPALVKIMRQPPVPQATPPPLAPVEAAKAEVSSAPVLVEKEKAQAQEKCPEGEGRKVTKKRASVVKKVKNKNRAPVVSIQPTSQVYATGESVILNASQTKDDTRNALTFMWEQLAGVPVRLKPMNSEGSQVSFVAPSTFNTVTNPVLIFKITATDPEGAEDSKEITIATKSRRHSAIWMGSR